MLVQHVSGDSVVRWNTSCTTNVLTEVARTTPIILEAHLDCFFILGRRCGARSHGDTVSSQPARVKCSRFGKSVRKLARD